MQVGVVGLLAHMLHLHMTTSSPSLQCLALSLVPPSHAHSEDSLTLTRLGHLVSWLRDTVPVNKHDSQEVSNSLTWETFELNNNVNVISWYIQQYPPTSSFSLVKEPTSACNDLH